MGPAVGVSRPNLTFATATGVAMSGLALAGSALTGGLLQQGPAGAGGSDAPARVERVALAPAPAGRPAVRDARRSDPAASALRAATDTAEVRRRVRAVPDADDRDAPATDPAAPDRQRAELVPTPQPGDDGARSPDAVSGAGGEGSDPAVPQATAARQVTLRVSDLTMDPATPRESGRLRLRLGVVEEAVGAPPATAPTLAPLPSGLEVVVDVPPVPEGKVLRVRVDLEHGGLDGTAAPNLHVLVSVVDGPSEGSDVLVTESAPSSATSSNTLDIVAPLGAPTSGQPAQVPPSRGTLPEEEPDPVEVRVPVLESSGDVQVVEVDVPPADDQPDPEAPPAQEPATLPEDDAAAETEVDEQPQDEPAAPEEPAPAVPEEPEAPEQAPAVPDRAPTEPGG